MSELTKQQRAWANDGLDLPNEQDSIDDYTIFRLSRWMKHRFKDYDLWETFQEDFSNFTLDDFKRIEKDAKKDLRNYLRTSGIYVSKNGHIAPALMAVLQQKEPTPWSIDDVLECMRKGERFDSVIIDNLLQTHRVALAQTQNTFTHTPSTVQSLAFAQDQSPQAVPQAASQAVPQTVLQAAPQPVPQTVPQASPYGHTKELTQLAKLYTDDLKYSGDNDNFDLKLRIFKDLCMKAEIPQAALPLAVSTMLKGSALEYYYSNVSNVALVAYDDVVQAVRNNFEGAEYRRGIQAKWMSISLQSVIDEDASVGKSTIDCFEILLKRLRHWYHGLSPELQSNVYMHQKLLLACRDMDACSYACYKPSDTLTGLINDLRSSIITHQTRKSNTTTQLMTDRRYFKRDPPRYSNGNGISPARPGKSGYRSSSTSYRNRPYNSRQSTRKTCHVCRKEGCWSTEHSKDEQEDAIRKYKERLNHRNDRSARAYIMGDESEEDTPNNDSDDDDLDHQMDDLNIDDRNDSLFTSFGTAAGAEALTIRLADNSFEHAITASTLVTDVPTDPFQYTTSPGRYTEDRFYGVVVDTGASKYSTAGYGQYLACKRLYQTNVDTSKAGAVNVQFGIGSASSIGSFVLKTPIGGVEFHIVHADTPLLLSLSDMDRLGVYLNNLKNILVLKSNPVKTLPVARRFGHVFLVWDDSLHCFISSSLSMTPCYLTNTELRQLHRRFGHPSARRLYDLLKNAGQDVVRGAIDQLSKFCHHCQKHGKAPGRFKFHLRDEVNFNHSIIIDVMYLDGNPVLHVVDEATGFNSGRWLLNLTSKHTWEMLRLCWIDVYIGPPDYIVHDAGLNFTSKEFRQYASSMGITTKGVPIEAHWSIGKVERFHALVRRTYTVIKEELGTSAPKDVVLQMAFKAINDTSGPNGLVPTLLVFGAYPRMVESDPPSPTMAHRAAAVAKASEEVRKFYSARQVADALSQRNGPNTTHLHDLPINSLVLVWREKGEWDGPFILLGMEGENCRIELPHGQRTFRSTAVKPYYSNDDDLRDLTAQGRQISSVDKRFNLSKAKPLT